MLRVIDSAQDAVDFMTWLSERHEGDMVAIDTETTGVDVYAPEFHVRLVQIGTANAAWVIPFDQWKGVVTEAVSKYRGVWAMWNATYDVGALEAEGISIPWPQVDDCMIASRIAEPSKSAALKEAAVRHVAGGAALSQRDLHEAMAKQKWGWDTVPLDFAPYVRYAAQDVILTSRLHQHPVIQSGINSRVMALEMQVLEICHRMETNGVRVDLTYAAEKADELRGTTGRIAEYLSARYDGLLPGSTQHLGRWFVSHGGTITEKTPGGRPSISKSQLQALALSGIPEVADVARHVLAYRKADKIVGTYLEGFGRLADSEGLLHPSIQTLAARTSRMSLRSPALQTLPKPNDDPDSQIVRRAIIPRNEGEVLLSADWSSIEARITASIANDASMIEAFRVVDDEGGDFFAEIGKVVFKDPGFTKKDPRRGVVKNCLYGILYGAGAAKLAQTVGIPESEAAEARSSILSAFPGLNEAMRRYEKLGQSGRVTNHYGRTLEVDEGKSYTGLNTVIQSDGADCLKRALVTLGHAGLTEAMVVPVHDEVVVSIPAEDVEEVQHILRESMRITDFAVTIPAEPSGPMERWGE